MYSFPCLQLLKYQLHTSAYQLLLLLYSLDRTPLVALISHSCHDAFKKKEAYSGLAIMVNRWRMRLMNISGVPFKAVLVFSYCYDLVSFTLVPCSTYGLLVVNYQCMDNSA